LHHERNSGLFDMGALYTGALDQVMRRAQSDAQLAALARPPRLPWPAPPSPGLHRRPPSPVALAPLLETDEIDEPIDLAEAFPRRRSHGLGWFGIAVAWLATVTIGGTLATTVPAHAFTRSHVHVISMVGASAAPAALVVPAPDVAWTAVPVAEPARAVEPPVARTPPVVAPVAAAAPPVAVATQVTAVAVPMPVHHAASAMPAARVATVLPATTLRAATAPAATAPLRASAEKVHVAPPAEPVEKPHPTAVPASTAGMSLDELIRHEVQVESAKTHH
jgi:hypothetical protein